MATNSTTYGAMPATGYMRQSQLIPAIVPFSSATLWRAVTLSVLDFEDQKSQSPPQPAQILDDMKIVLMRVQLLCSDMRNGERVVGRVSDHGIAVAVVVGSRQQRVNVREVRLAELDGVRVESEVCDSDLAKIRREHEGILFANMGDAHLAGARGRLPALT